MVNVSEAPLVVAVVIAAPAVGGVAGVFQGAVGISGPIVGSWIHSYRLPRGAHILSVTSLFFITGLAQLVVLISTGELSGMLGISAAALCLQTFFEYPGPQPLRGARWFGGLRG